MPLLLILVLAVVLLGGAGGIGFAGPSSLLWLVILLVLVGLLCGGWGFRTWSSGRRDRRGPPIA